MRRLSHGGAQPGSFACFDQPGRLSIGQRHRVAYVLCDPSIWCIFMLGTPLSLDRHADPARRRGFFFGQQRARWRDHEHNR
jgi:hypothetical protein